MYRYILIYTKRLNRHMLHAYTKVSHSHPKCRYSYSNLNNLCMCESGHNRSSSRMATALHLQTMSRARTNQPNKRKCLNQ